MTESSVAIHDRKTWLTLLESRFGRQVDLIVVDHHDVDPDDGDTLGDVSDEIFGQDGLSRRPGLMWWCAPDFADGLIITLGEISGLRSRLTTLNLSLKHANNLDFFRLISDS